jgi:hypothetical protein
VRSYLFIGNKKCRIYAACGVSQTPNYYTDNKFNKTLCQEIYLNWGEYSVSNGISIGEASKSERLSGSRIALFMYYETHLN